jgi:hypothetical protein
MVRGEAPSQVFNTEIAEKASRSANSGRVFTCASTVQMLRKVVDSELDSAVIEEAKRTLKATRNANNSGLASILDPRCVARGPWCSFQPHFGPPTSRCQ